MAALSLAAFDCVHMSSLVLVGVECDCLLFSCMALLMWNGRRILKLLVELVMQLVCIYHAICCHSQLHQCHAVNDWALNMYGGLAWDSGVTTDWKERQLGCTWEVL